MNSKEKNDLVNRLKAIKEKESTTLDETAALEKAISKIKRAKRWEDCIKVVDILLKMLGVGSKFFDT